MKRNLRGEHYTNLTHLSVGLRPEHMEQFNKVKHHLGLVSNASVLRTLVIQRARLLERREQYEKEDQS